MNAPESGSIQLLLLAKGLSRVMPLIFVSMSNNFNEMLTPLFIITQFTFFYFPTPIHLLLVLHLWMEHKHSIHPILCARAAHAINRWCICSFVSITFPIWNPNLIITFAFHKHRLHRACLDFSLVVWHHAHFEYNACNYVLVYVSAPMRVEIEQYIW